MNALLRAVRRAPRGRLAPDAGVTLVELLVTMLLLGLLGGVVGTTFAAATASLQRSTSRQENTALAQTGMENLTRSLRASALIQRSGDQPALPAVAEATQTSVQVHTFLGARPTRVRYWVDGAGRLMETAEKADASSSAPFWTFTGAPTTRVIINRVVNTSAQPLFTYLDGTGTPLPGASLSEAQRRGVRSIEVTLVVQGDATARVRPASIQQRVQLPNLGSIG